MKNQVSIIKHILLLILFAIVSVFVAYQSRVPTKILVADASLRNVSGFYYVEHAPEHSFRWTRGNGTVHFSGVGKSALNLTVIANAWRHENQIFTATVTANGTPIGVIDRAGWRTWRFTISDNVVFPGDDLVVGFNSIPFVPSEIAESGDDRQLGIAVDSVEIQPKWNGSFNDLVIPSLPQLLFVLVFVGGLYLFSQYLGLSERWAFMVGMVAVVLFAIAITLFRLEASQRIVIFVLGVGVIAATVGIRGWQSLLARADSSKWRRAAWWAIPLGIAMVALVLRVHALTRLPVEGDDSIYMGIVENYYHAIIVSDWRQVITFDAGEGHPILFKLIFASSLIVRDMAKLGLSNVEMMRTVAVLFGAIQAGMIALLNPLAGWFLAIQTTEVKFTSMVYLEALPALTAALAVIAFECYRQSSKDRWLYLSALALGATGASKFIYIVVGFAVLPFLLWEQRRQPLKIIGYGLVVAFAFFALDPYLWYDPVGRMLGMFSFHGSFSTREYVKELARPWWYNVVWLAGPAKIYAPDYMFPNVFLIMWDTLIYGLALLGLPSLWHKSRLFFAWLVVGVIFVSLWEAKWEQYSLVIATPLCMAAGYFVADVAGWVKKKSQARIEKGSNLEVHVTSN
ncbi:MAG: hypothetical protein HZB51_33610 [Chloroflexi bacterium]|nr:hypothetical protein [Chloroflexota bacterium]